MLAHLKCKAPSLIYILTLCSLTILSQNCYADHLQLPDIEVQGKRPQSHPASMLYNGDTAKMLLDEPGVSLYQTGGVSSLPAIRGLADDRLRIKVDGMDLISSCPNHMNPPLSYLDPSQLESLKVYAGITPVSLGGDSIGGTIIAQTSKPLFASTSDAPLIKGQVGSYYKSNNDARGLNLQASYASETFSASYTGATAKANNYVAGGNFKISRVTGRVGHLLDLDEVGSTAYETSNQTLGFAWRNGQHLLEAKLGYQNLPNQLYPNQRMDMLDNEQKRLNLRYAGDFDWGNIEARAYHEQVDHMMDFGADKRYWYGGASGGNTGVGGSGNGQPCANPGSATCANGMPMYSEGKTIGASLKTAIHLTPEDLLRVGAELQRYTLDDYWEPSGAMMRPNRFLNINNGERDRTALYSEWEKQYNSAWSSLAGVRYEHVKTDADNVQGYDNTNANGSNQARDSTAFNASNRKQTDHNWDLTALARYKHDPQLDIEFGVARKVRTPNLYERYTWSTWQMAALMNNTAGDGNGYFGDVNLKPEKAHTVSATFDWHAPDQAWTLKATPFFTYVDDYIDAVQWNSATNTARTTRLDNQFTVLRYANQSARLFGIDLSGTAWLGDSSAGAFSVKGLLNYTNGKNKDTGDDLYNIMPLNTKLALNHLRQQWDTSLELILVKDKNNVADQRNEIKTPGYGLLNLRSSYTWKQARVEFSIDNLLDKKYYLPLGGAYVGQGTTMTLAPNNIALGSIPLWGTAVPGMGRSINVGVTLNY
jgi:iron complex outermembrane recepter protein